MTTDQQVSNWNIANVLTVLRIAMVPLFGWALLHDGGNDTVLAGGGDPPGELAAVGQVDPHQQLPGGRFGHRDVIDPGVVGSVDDDGAHGLDGHTRHHPAADRSPTERVLLSDPVPTVCGCRSANRPTPPTAMPRSGSVEPGRTTSGTSAWSCPSAG